MLLSFREVGDMIFEIFIRFFDVDVFVIVELCLVKFLLVFE